METTPPISSETYHISEEDASEPSWNQTPLMEESSDLTDSTVMDLMDYSTPTPVSVKLLFGLMMVSILRPLRQVISMRLFGNSAVTTIWLVDSNGSINKYSSLLVFTMHKLHFKCLTYNHSGPPGQHQQEESCNQVPMPQPSLTSHRKSPVMLVTSYLHSIFQLPQNNQVYIESHSEWSQLLGSHQLLTFGPLFTNNNAQS